MIRIPKKITLSDYHRSMGAKMVEFAGFEMPIQYLNIKEEHISVRTKVGLFDVSHMGQFRIMGEEATSFIDWLTSNDVKSLTNGKIQYSCLLNPTGGIVDDLLVYQISKEEYYVVVNASNIQKDWDWFEKNNHFKAQMSNESDKMSLFALQGPKANEVLSTITELKINEMPYYTFVIGTVAGISSVMVSTTGYTGAGGFEFIVPNEQALELWQALIEAGQEFDIQPIGLAARDTLRTEMGFCLYGNDINDSTSPIEAGLGWITKFNAPFLSEEYQKKLKTEGVTRKLIGFKMIDKGIPRSHYEIMDSNDTKIGEVTSGTFSPTLEMGLGMGYVLPHFSKEGTEIYIKIREKKYLAQVAKLPLHK